MKALLVLALGLTLTGCASTGTPTAIPTPTPDPTRFVPNYLPEISSGRQWISANLTVHLDTTGKRDLTPAYTVALGAWEEAYGTLFHLARTTLAEADIVVELVPPGSLGGTTIGLTTVTFRTSDNRILDGVIQLDSGVDDALLAQVFAHELGHVLGIDGHSTQDADLMFPRAHLPLRVTLRDRNTLLTINANRLTTESRKKDDGNRVSAVVCRFEKP